MFEDFSSSDSTQQKKRLRRSLTIAAVVYCSAGAAIVSATNKAQQLVKETLRQVEFAPPPEVKPEPPPPEPEPSPQVEKPKPKPAARAGRKRAELKPPDVLPQAKPPESAGPLPDVAAQAPMAGVIGVAGGTGTASKGAAAEPAPRLVPAKELPGNKAPPYPLGPKRDGIEGDVLVAFDVLPDGRVANPQIVSGPQEFHEVVLKTALTWRFQPATLGGQPVKDRRTKLITFRGED
jgi:protein TonB